MPDDRDIPTALPVDEPDDGPRRPARRRPSGPPPRRSGVGTFFNWLTRILLVICLFVIFVLLLMLLPTLGGGTGRLTEMHHSGDPSAADKIAIVRVDGPIVEGLLRYPTQQIKDAAADEQVKAVVVAINSPGGTVTASDLLHKQIQDLRDGKWEKQPFKKPVVVAMESVAASGGYYIAVPAQEIYAQPTTVTGSIGVYAAFLDLHGLGEKYGIDVQIIKKGELKGGSLFKEMTPEERIHWEQLIGHSYDRFMKVVTDGRDGQPAYGKRLTLGLRDEIRMTTADGQAYVRRLADGGVFTADDALKYGLIDHIGYLEDAIAGAKRLAGITAARVVTYQRPSSVLDSLLGIEQQPPDQIRLDQLPGASAQLWYLTPGYELSSITLPANLLK
jgi:protease-4